MDVVARVAAVSPVIRVKNAPPFFMVEVEQLEHPRQTCSTKIGDKEKGLPPSKWHSPDTNPRCPDNCPDSYPDSYPDNCPDNCPESCPDSCPDNCPDSCPIKKDGKGRSMLKEICRSPEEIAAIFASSTETRPVSTGNPVGGIYRENGEANVLRVSVKPSAVRFRGRVLSEGIVHEGFSCGQRGSKGCTSDGHHRSSVSEEANIESKPKEQLMTNLVLNGQRCLPWQAFITPGNTYVFPAMGAFVLGGGKKIYRAFGDAAGGKVETKVGQPIVLPGHGGYIERMLISPREQR